MHKVDLEDGVDNVTTNRRTSTEDGSITQLLSKLLAVGFHLARLGRRPRLRTARNIEGHVTVIAGSRRRGSVGRHDALLLLADVASGENALHAGALVASLPPLVVHVLGDLDLVVGHEGQVAGVLGVVLVHC